MKGKSMPPLHSEITPDKALELIREYLPERADVAEQELAIGLGDASKRGLSPASSATANGRNLGLRKSSPRALKATYLLAPALAALVIVGWFVHSRQGDSSAALHAEPAVVGVARLALSEVPAHDARGGASTRGTISGSVTGAPAGARVVLYAFTDQWYVQPTTGEALTPIRNGTWTSPTHLGRKYAALLVGPQFVAEYDALSGVQRDEKLPPVSSVLPDLKGAVLHVVVSSGSVPGASSRPVPQ
jgi:hypothetical protein